MVKEDVLVFDGEMKLIEWRLDEENVEELAGNTFVTCGEEFAVATVHSKEEVLFLLIDTVTGYTVGQVDEKVKMLMMIKDMTSNNEGKEKDELNHDIAKYFHFMMDADAIAELKEMRERHQDDRVNPPKTMAKSEWVEWKMEQVVKYGK